MKSINNNAPVKCSKTILVNAGAEEVWQVLTAINDWHAWQTEISDPRLEGAIQEKTSFKWQTGGVTIRSVLHTVVPFQYFGWTGKTFGLFAIHNWTLKEADGITEVRVDESMEGFLASVFKKSFNTNLEKGMRTWLELLKARCEK